MNYKMIGKELTRLDSVTKVTGEAKFCADLLMHGTGYIKVFHSIKPHANIKNIDVSEAENCPGVMAVITGQDFPFIGGETLADMPFLAIDRVRYIGEPVAAVAAASLEQAEQAVRLIKVVYEDLPVVFDMDAALATDTPILHEDVETYRALPVVHPVSGTNICNKTQKQYGDIDKGFAEADYVFENSYSTPAVQHAQIEPYAAMALVNGEGHIRIWSPNSGPHRLRKNLSDALAIPLHMIQVTSTYVGGSFGGKSFLDLEPIAVLLALRLRNVPVKLVYTREEVFSCTAVRHPTTIKIKTGVKKNGQICARSLQIYYDTGAYATFGPSVMLQGADCSPGPYKVPNMYVEGFAVYTNKLPSGAFRGYGCTQVAWAYENQMDEIAEALHIDPVELRLVNALGGGDVDAFGNIVHGVGLKECIVKAAEEIGWEKASSNVQRSGTKIYAKGLACSWERTKTPSASTAYIVLNFDGTVNVTVSAIDLGQGIVTSLAQVVSESLGVNIKNIRFSTSDTLYSPFDTSSTASRTTFHLGNALIIAAEDIKLQLKKLALPLLKAGSEDELSIGDGYVGIINSERMLSFQEIVFESYPAGGAIFGRGFYYPNVGGGLYAGPSIYYMYQAQAVEIAVDTETGHIEIEKIAAAHDAGKAINPMICQQQIEGGVAQGVGTVLFEEVLWNDGEVLNPNLHDYKIPTAKDIDYDIVPMVVEQLDPNGPYGAKGMAEPVLIPTGPAIGNALSRAIGRRIRHMSLKPEIVFDEIQLGLKRSSETP